jgi:hypothetical protein
VTAFRFNHMEITIPKGAATPAFRDEVDAFYGDVFGFSCRRTRMFNEDCVLMDLPTGDFILLIEGDGPLSAPGFDHLGIRMPDRAGVDVALGKIKAWQAKDDRVQLKEYDDAEMDGVMFHAFYVKHLLPIWFDVQSVDQPTEAELLG